MTAFPTYDSKVGFSQDGAVLFVKNGGSIVLESGAALTGINVLVNTNFINLKTYGCLGDGVTDDHDKFLLALQDANTQGVAVYMPAGRYRVANTHNFNLSNFTSVHIFGDGPTKSVLFYDDDVQLTRRDCFSTGTTTPLGNMYFRDFAIESTRGVGGDYTTRSHLMEVFLSGELRFDNMLFTKSRFFGTVVHTPIRAIVTNSTWENIDHDGCALRDVRNCKVIGNHFNQVLDDCCSIHIADATPAPVENGIVVMGNTIQDSQGICILGAKNVQVDNNIMRRIHTRAIEVGTGQSFSQGDTSEWAVSISNNQITDVFNGSNLDPGHGFGSSIRWIYVSPDIPSTDGTGHFIGQTDGAGGIVQPWNYLYTNNVNSVGPSLGSYCIKIQGNTCMRTLAPTANYSDYGFGQRMMRSGFVNPAIVMGTIIGGTQIEIANHSWNMLIANNILWGAGTHGIYLNGTVSSSYVSWKNVLVSNNVIGNYLDTAIFMEGTGTVEAIGNNIDGDPLQASPERAANGKWTNAAPPHYAFRNSGTVAHRLVNNHVRNVGQFIAGSSTSLGSFEGNVLYCNPAGLGNNSQNIGIRVIGNPAEYGTVQIEDGDPASTSYGTLINPCLLAATAKPSTGKYVQGHFVKNSTPAISGTATLGWLRLTTGSSHTTDTDWRAISA